MSVVVEQKIPKGWTIKKISELTQSYSGGTPSTSKKDYWNSNDISWIKSGEIKNNIINEPQHFISKKGYENSSAKLYPVETVLVAITGATTGKTAFLLKEACGTQNVFGILPCEVIFPKYLWYFMQNYYTKLLSKVIGTAQKHVNGTIIKNTEIALPPLNEQKRIVSKIEELFSLVDSAKDTLEKTKILLKQYRQSILKHAFEGKLVSQDPNDEPASVLLDKIKKENPDKKFSEIIEKKELPNGWIVCKINDVCDLMGGGTPSRANLEYFGGDIPWLTPTEIPKNKITIISQSKEKITKLGLEKSSAKLIPKNSVLLTSRASIGYVAIAGINLTTNQGFASFITHDIIYNFFLAYWLSNNKKLLESNARGTTFKEISKSTIRELPIFIPPINEQKRIVTKIEELFSVVEKNEKIVDQLLIQCVQMKKSILKQAFEGKLVPQDPNDEPAEILLQRIKEGKNHGK